MIFQWHGYEIHNKTQEPIVYPSGKTIALLDRYTQKGKSVIYIEEESFEKQISILHFLSKRENLEIIMWLFPESKTREFCDISLAPKGLSEGKPVTTYGDDFQSRKTKRVKTTDILFTKIQNEKQTIAVNCDSLVLYRPQTKEWLACTIEHENILMIADDSLLDTLVKQGFNPSLKEPSSW